MSGKSKCFVVAEECARLGLRAGAIIFRELQICPSDDSLLEEITEEIATIRRRYADATAVRADSVVVRFQEVLRSVGVNPRKEPPSLEKLLSSAVRHGKIPAINALVDSYNLVSVRYSVSLGAHDLDRITLPVTLRILTGAETFVPLGRESPEAIVAGEYAYVDASNRVLCRLDIRQADFSKVTAATRNALLIVEGTSSHSTGTLQEALVLTREMILRHCRGTAEVVAGFE